MDKMICENCGGHINPRTYKCEYCDTQYKREANGSILKVETFTNPIAILGRSIDVPFEALRFMNDVEVAAFCNDKLAEEFAKELMKYTEMQIQKDPLDLSFKVKARIRVVQPKHLFT